MSRLPTTFLDRPCPFCELLMLYRMPGVWRGLPTPLACANPACDSNFPPDREEEPREGLADPCPVCDERTLYRPPGHWPGLPAACWNPDCDSNNPRP